MSGYTHKGTDLDAIFEPYRAGDAKHSESVGTEEQGVDMRDRYTAVASGDKFTEDVGHAHKGVDFRNIFAVKGSVPRFNPLPWANTFAPSQATIYRQPSRALATKIFVKTRVLMDGRVEIVASSPARDSKPNGNTETVLYALTSEPAWEDDEVPAGVDMEIRFDRSSGLDSIMEGGLSFGQWYRLDGSPSEAGTSVVINYNHRDTAHGLKQTGSSVRISLRRTDYPNTHKTDGIITVNLKLNVLASLFTDPEPYLRDLVYHLDVNTYQNPEERTRDYWVSTKYEIFGNGTLVTRRSVNGSAWNEIMTTKWRRDVTGDTTAADFEYRFSQTTGMTVNPAPNWTAVPAGSEPHEAIFHHVVPDNATLGVKRQYSKALLEFRQKSTLSYHADANWEGGWTKATTEIEIIPPMVPPWGPEFNWPDANITTSTPYDPTKPNTKVSAYISAVFQETNSVDDHKVKFYRSPAEYGGGGSTSLGEAIFLDPLWNAGYYEVRVTILSQSGSGALTGQCVGNWVTMNGTLTSITARAERLMSANQGTTSYTVTGKIEIRRKAYPTQIHSDTFTWTVNAFIDEPDLLLYPPSLYTEWARTYTNDNVHQIYNYVPEPQTFVFDLVKTEISDWDNYGLRAGDNVPRKEFLWYRQGSVPSVRTWNFRLISGGERNSAHNGIIAFQDFLPGEHNLGPSRFTAKFKDSAGRIFTGDFYYREEIHDQGLAGYYLNNEYNTGSTVLAQFFQYMYQAWLQSDKKMVLEISNLVY